MAASCLRKRSLGADGRRLQPYGNQLPIGQHNRGIQFPRRHGRRRRRQARHRRARRRHPSSLTHSCERALPDACHISAAGNGSGAVSSLPEPQRNQHGDTGRHRHGCVDAAGQPGLTPNLVKAILEYTSQPYPGHEPLTQWAGFLNGARSGRDGATPPDLPCTRTPLAGVDGSSGGRTSFKEARSAPAPPHGTTRHDVGQAAGATSPARLSHSLG